MSRAFYTDAYPRQIRRIIPDLIRSRGLLWDLISKDLRARYRNAVIGFVWAILQPLLMTLILTFVFTMVFPNRGAGFLGPHHFAVYLLCGLVFWQFFAACLGQATASLLTNHDLVKKAYFPREVIPLASLGVCAVNGAIGFGVFVVVRCVLESGFGWGLVWLPVIFVIQCMLIIGLALLCSSLNVFYRDVAYVVDVALAFGFYATPIFYGIDMVKSLTGRLYSIYMLNPMVGIITSYRQALLDNQAPSAEFLLYPLVCSVVILIAGAIVYRRKAATIADHL